jgi:calcium/calmodulin-dependent 3',5'-cyclic nucleotide phosphodiesterase
MRYLLGELLAAYGLIDKFDIQFDTLVRFADQLEFGYNLHSNPYHNSLHACDVLQTTHYHIHASGISNWLSGKLNPCLCALSQLDRLLFYEIDRRHF